MSEISCTELEQKYWHYLLTEGCRPKSVYAFTHSIEQEEGVFYQHYATFEALESTYWKRTVDETIEVLEADEDYASYPADQKLLAFYFTYFTHVQKHRSRLTEYFPKSGIATVKTLHGMRESFRAFAKSIIDQGVEEGIFADRKKLLEYYDRGMFEHFRVMIVFYIKDTSEDFQDTDAFIEKSVKFAIDGAASGVLESGLDFARFMIGKIPGASEWMNKLMPK